MAKKATTVEEKVDMKKVLAEFKSIANSKFKDLSKYGSVLSSSIYGEIPEYIDTGSYALNRLISGSIYGGIPAGRVISFYGDCVDYDTIITIRRNGKEESIKIGDFVTEFLVD